ncbi:MAG: Rne/Rng family ribonuclease [Nitrospina sp.]|nr:Rne/Rng family ribonuclease [Nitrospina sp.]
MRKNKTDRKVMLINSQHSEECRAVVLDNNIIQDYIVEHSSREQIKGNIYLGVINRVEPSIEAAFVDFGGKKFGFLPFKDVLKESYISTGEKKAKIRIQDVLIRGQRILVQVAKESRDAKGPSLTNAMSLAGRFLVLMQGHGSAVSRKIEDESERKKLKDIVAEFNLPDDLGLIIRTAGLGQTKVELQKDMQMLRKIWDKIEEAKKNEVSSAPFLIYQEPSLVVRTVRDHFSSDTAQIIVDNAEAYKALKEFVDLVMPRNRNLVKFYKETKPLFSEYKVEEQIESIYKRTVLLPSGGSIVIDIGEAMVSVDVNSGKTKGGLDLEETAVTTNLEAATEVARQLRLRDLGGLIVIDFIDMFSKKNKASVEKEVKQACKTDKARINIARISKFGLLEMSRQRISPPVKEGIFVQCGQCAGSGLVRSIDSLSLNVLRKIHEIISTVKVKVLALEVTPEVSNYLLNHKLGILTELKAKHLVDFQFKISAGLSYENYKYNVVEVWPSEPSLDNKVSETASTVDNAGVSSETGEQVKQTKPARTPRPARSSRPGRTAKSAKPTRSPRPPRSRKNETPKSENPVEAVSEESIASESILKKAPEQSVVEASQTENNAVESTDSETAKPNPKRRYSRRKPVTRRGGAQKGRRRRPTSASSPDGSPEVDGNTAQSGNESSLGKSDSSADINKPMPPMPIPFVRDNKKMATETPAPKESNSSNDGSAD